MESDPATVSEGDFNALLNAEPGMIAPWTVEWNLRRIAFHAGAIVLGAGCFGAAMGFWRSPENALYVAIKLPLIMLGTAFGNALLNSMLAPLLGLNLRFRQSLLAILMSFVIVAAILGAFSPLIGFLVWNAPPMSAEVKTTATYALIKLACTLVIAFAGIAGNVKLLQLLTELGRRRSVALRVLFAWLLVNLFLGSQLVWIARPFIGTPALPVEFLRETAFQGNFYDNVWATLLQLMRFD